MFPLLNFCIKVFARINAFKSIIIVFFIYTCSEFDGTNFLLLLQLNCGNKGVRVALPTQCLMCLPLMSPMNHKELLKMTL